MIRTYLFPGVLRGLPGPRLATTPTIRPRRSLSSPWGCYILKYRGLHQRLTPATQSADTPEEPPKSRREPRFRLPHLTVMESNSPWWPAPVQAPPTVPPPLDHDDFWAG